MVGLGEKRSEVAQVMDDLRTAEVDFLTLGQYLQPTRKHHEVVEFVTPEPSRPMRRSPTPRASKMVAASPLTRSSQSRRRGFRAPTPKARRQNGAAAGWLTGGDLNSGRLASDAQPP